MQDPDSSAQGPKCGHAAWPYNRPVHMLLMSIIVRKQVGCEWFLPRSGHCMAARHASLAWWMAMAGTAICPAPYADHSGCSHGMMQARTRRWPCGRRRSGRSRTRASRCPRAPRRPCCSRTTAPLPAARSPASCSCVPCRCDDPREVNTSGLRRTVTAPCTGRSALLLSHLDGRIQTQVIDVSKDR